MNLTEELVFYCLTCVRRYGIEERKIISVG